MGPKNRSLPLIRRLDSVYEYGEVSFLNH